MSQNFGLLDFKKLFTLFLFYYFPFLDKTCNNENQENFIICQKQPH